MSGRLWRCAAAVAVAVAVALVPPAAFAQPQQEFEAALEQLGRGENARAAADLEKFAKDNPDNHNSADALFTAARVHAESLAAPAKAAKLYQAITTLYPHSRVARAARRHLENLAPLLGPGGRDAEVANAWRRIQQRAADRPAADIAPIVDAHVKSHPTWGGQAEALMWIAARFAREGAHTTAILRYRAVAKITSAPRAQFDALRAAFDLALPRDLAVAHAIAQELPTDGDNTVRRDIATLTRTLKTQQQRRNFYWAAHAWVAAVFLGLLAVLRRTMGDTRETLKSLLRPSTEALYLVPPSILLAFMAVTDHPQAGPAVLTILGLGIALSWCTGTVMNHLHHRWALLFTGLAGASAVVAATYIALHRNNLIDLLITTVRYGPDV